MGVIYQEVVKQLSSAYGYNPFRMARILGGGWGTEGRMGDGDLLNKDGDIM